MCSGMARLALFVVLCVMAFMDACGAAPAAVVLASVTNTSREVSEEESLASPSSQQQQQQQILNEYDDKSQDPIYPTASNFQRGTRATGRFRDFRVCDLSRPHDILGLPSLKATAPPSLQAVWVAYYSRVVVAEHEPLEFSLAKLYCAANAAKLMLFESDPERYFMFAPLLPEEILSEYSVDAKTEEAFSQIFEYSVTDESEGEAMLLHPDIFDLHVVKALLTIGWQELRFYGDDIQDPVWIEWVEDERVERLTWITHMDREIALVDQQMEDLTTTTTTTTTTTMHKNKEQVKRVKLLDLTAAKEVPPTVRAAKANAVERVRTKVARRRLNPAKHEMDYLEQVKMELEAGKKEMEKVNLRWFEQLERIKEKWRQFYIGGSDRVSRNKTATKGGESWEGALQWIAKKYAESPEGQRDYCEGYLLETILEVNKVKRINGNAWKQNAQKRASFHDLDMQLHGEDLAQRRHHHPQLFLSNEEEEEEEILAAASLEEDLDKHMDAVLEELLEGLDGIDIDLDDVVDELLEMNEQDIYRDIIGNTYKNDPLEVQEQALAVVRAVEGVVDDMIRLEEKHQGYAIHDADHLGEVLMRKGQDLLESTSSSSSSLTTTRKEERDEPTLAEKDVNIYKARPRVPNEPNEEPIVVAAFM